MKNEGWELRHFSSPQTKRTRFNEKVHKHLKLETVRHGEACLESQALKGCGRETMSSRPA